MTEVNASVKEVKRTRYHQRVQGKWYERADWGPAIFLSITPVFAIGTTLWYFLTEPFEWWIVGLFLFFYFATGMSITAGYHRLFAHKAFEAGFLTRLFFALFGAAAFQNSILKWVVDHRPHHRYVDTPKDPYSAKNGFMFSHIWWMYSKAIRPKPEYWVKDLMKDPIVVFQDRYYVPVAVFMGLVLPALIGWAFGSWLGGLAIAGFLRLVIVHHFTFFINSLAHYSGKQTYSDSHTAKDNPWIALFTYGEGFHNFHHEFANDYRNGIRWYDYDPTKWLIRGLSWVGEAKNLKKIPEERIFAAKMAMEQKHMESKIKAKTSGPRVQASIHELQESFQELQASFQEHLKAVQGRFEKAKVRFASMRSEYEGIRIQKIKMKMNPQAKEQFKKRLQAARQEMKEARREMKEAYKLWRECLRTYSQMSLQMA